jgi:hypothetical protein
LEENGMTEKRTRNKKAVSFYPLSLEQVTKRIFDRKEKPKGTGKKKKLLLRALNKSTKTGR